MDKLYTRIDEKLKLGSDFTDLTIFPSLVEVQATEFVKQQEAYVMQKLMEFQINPDTLENQLKEIYRLNAVVDQLEKALDKACEEMSSMGCFNSKEAGKEYFMREVTEDE